MSSQRLVQCVNCNVIVELPEVAQGWLDMTPVTRWLFQYGIGWRSPECSVPFRTVAEQEILVSARARPSRD
jgi:hypothetical protein